MANLFENLKLYDRFSLGEDNIILPVGSALSKLYDRMTGNRIVEVIDVNGNHQPDSGDVGITFFGDRIENIQLREPPSFPDKKEPVSDLFIASHPLRDKNCYYDVERIERDSLQSLAVQLAQSIQDYLGARYEEAGKIARSLSDHPAASASILGLSFLVMLHPKGRALMEGVAIGGGFYGLLSMFEDRYKGIFTDEKMGSEDLVNLLAIQGALLPLKGITFSSFLGDSAALLKSVFSHSNPPFCMQLAGGRITTAFAPQAALAMGAMSSDSIQGLQALMSGPLFMSKIKEEAVVRGAKVSGEYRKPELGEFNESLGSLTQGDKGRNARLSYKEFQSGERKLIQARFERWDMSYRIVIKASNQQEAERIFSYLYESSSRHGWPHYSFGIDKYSHNGNLFMAIDRTPIKGAFWSHSGELVVDFHFTKSVSDALKRADLHLLRALILDFALELEELPRVASKPFWKFW